MDTYEKKYKEALERAREYWETDNDNTLDIKAKGTMEYLFPELKESEDERIRKELISLVENWKIFNPNSPFDEHPVYTSDKDTVDKILAWLEKQGETYTKKDVDNAYLEGMAFAKDELEKQGKQKSQRMISAEAKEAMYDKPAWSKEDDVRLQACIDALQAESLMGKVDTVMTKWLESLKQRIEGKL